jgi:hypothetical protein
LLHGVEQGHHTQLIPYLINYANFASANSLVDSETTIRTTAFCDKPTSREQRPSGFASQFSFCLFTEARLEGTGQKV